MTVLTKERISILDTGLDIGPNGYQYRSNIVTLSDYWEFYYEHPDYSYEYNNGILEVKPVAKKIDVFWVN